MPIEIEAKLMVDSPDDETVADVQRDLERASLTHIAESYARLIEQIKQKALVSEKVMAAMLGKEVKKIIVIKSRLVNIVV